MAHKAQGSPRVLCLYSFSTSVFVSASPWPSIHGSSTGYPVVYSILRWARYRSETRPPSNVFPGDSGTMPHWRTIVPSRGRDVHSPNTRSYGLGSSCGRSVPGSPRRLDQIEWRDEPCSGILHRDVDDSTTGLHHNHASGRKAQGHVSRTGRHRTVALHCRAGGYVFRDLLIFGAGFRCAYPSLQVSTIPVDLSILREASALVSPIAHFLRSIGSTGLVPSLAPSWPPRSSASSKAVNTRSLI